MMALFRNAKIYTDGNVKTVDLLFDGVTLSAITGDLPAVDAACVFDNIAVLPGFCDVHVHLREPGFSYKETVKSGTLAAARGGCTAVCTMPNLSPAPDTPEHLGVQLDIIRRDAQIAVFPLGTITMSEAGSELSEMEEMADSVVGYSDDGRGVQSEDMMRQAMLRAKALGKPIVAHCEDNSLLRGGYIHDGEYARAHGHRGICSESEWRQIERDLALAEETGVAYHVCHVSTKESVELIRRAKARGVNVTAETGPHYLILDDSRLEEDGRFKMNPPLRSPSDREAMIEGVLDGTIDFIATDHAPHSAEEKSRGLEKSAMGVVGIETAFALMYTHFVRSGKMSMEKLVDIMSRGPRERFGIKSDVGFTVFDLSSEYEIKPEDLLSMGKSTPFAGDVVFGECLATVYDGEARYLSDKLG